VPVYAERLRTGVLNPHPRPRVVRRDGAMALVDGDSGPGQVAAVMATDLSIQLAREHGIGIVSVRRSGHYGAAGYYAIRAAEAGLVGMSMTNTEPLVIPYGGAAAALGTNPIAFAAPTRDGIFNLDMATSQVAMNKVFNARSEGRAIPEGWGVDARGEPTTDPDAAVFGVPLGGYKGYGLALMVEILCGVLAGAGVRGGVGNLYSGGQERQNSGHFHLALDPQRTVGRDAFAGVLGGLLDELRAIPPAPGFDEVLVAGDPEDRAREERERTGIPVEPALWARLCELSDELGVSVPAAS
jgi:LDH2 family malate/lactate/ureidoglycolate dehydrogenase